MRMAKIITILLAFGLLLTGCVKEIPDETTAPEPVKQTATTASQEETTEPEADIVVFPAAPEAQVEKPLPDQSEPVTDYWTQGLHFGDKNTALTYYISIPQIYPFSTDAVTCQKEIYELYANRLYDNLTVLQVRHQGNIRQFNVPKEAFFDSSFARSYTYIAGFDKNVLTIAVRFDIEESENANCYVYYLDLTTGKRLSPETAQEKLAVDTEVIINAVEACYQEMHTKMDTADWYQELLEKTVSDDNIKACRVFLTKDGRKMLAAPIYTAGSVETVEIIIPLSDNGKADERTLSLFELEFSDELVAELEVAYKNRLIENASFDISDDTVKMYWEGMNPNGGGAFQYYGTFDDCVVWVAQLQTEAIVDFELAGSRFYNRNGISFFVCRNSELIMLEEAYEQGFISAEDIAIVAGRHWEYNEAHGTMP